MVQSLSPQHTSTSIAPAIIPASIYVSFFILFTRINYNIPVNLYLFGRVNNDASCCFRSLTDYKWVFSEWAIARGNRLYTSDGHYFRDINLNPNGFAMHCECIFLSYERLLVQYLLDFLISSSYEPFALV